MSTAIRKILSQLSEIFAPMDKEVLAASKEWAIGRMKALHDFKQSAECQALRSNQGKYSLWTYYNRLYEIAGGKTWYNVFDGRGQEAVLEFVEKNCQATITKRNAKIAQKLEKASVTEIVSERYRHSDDGFDGVYAVNTNAGEKTVKISTVRAGGYNIQCLHLRVLVSIK